MFWHRDRIESRTAKRHVFIAPPPPANKHFKLMLELIKDAEKYDNSGQKDISEAILDLLCKKIEAYKSPKTQAE